MQPARQLHLSEALIGSALPLRLGNKSTAEGGAREALHHYSYHGPRACRYDTLRRAHHSFLTCCIGWRKHSCTDHPISYLDTLVKTGSESIEATLRKRRILLAEFVARMEDTRLSKCVMFGESVGGAGSAGVKEKEWMGCLLDDLRVFGIHPDKWTIAAQDEEE